MHWFDDPDIFFDGTVDEDVVLGGATVRAIISDNQELSRGGSVVAPTVGEHSSILVRKAAVSERPQVGDTVEAGGGTYTVRNVMDSGSCWKLTATRNQRRAR